MQFGLQNFVIPISQFFVELTQLSLGPLFSKVDIPETLQWYYITIHLSYIKPKCFV